MQTLFKQAMSRFATGVCVVTYFHPDHRGIDGVTISAFSSLSLAPLKILFCLGNDSLAHQTFGGVERFTVNFLNSEQASLAYQFAGRQRQNLDNVVLAVDGLPMIKDSLATLICEKGHIYTEGDHDIVIGEVQRVELGGEHLQPLLYYQSEMIEGYQHV